MRVFILLSMVSFVLGACGIKPSSVEPPEGAGKRQYPATYPNPNTDP